jgi:ERCC4-type nuclease
VAKEAKAPFVILIDSRERTPPPFPDGCITQRVTMAEADYTTPYLQGIAVIERKGSDFASSLTHDRERFDDEIRRLLGYKWRCIIVENDLTAVYRETLATPNSILGSIASLYARWDCPVLFAGNAHGAGRLIAGVLRRWEERHKREAEQTASTEHPTQVQAETKGG